MHSLFQPQLASTARSLLVVCYGRLNEKGVRWKKKRNIYYRIQSTASTKILYLFQFLLVYPLKYSFETEGEAVKPEDKKTNSAFYEGQVRSNEIIKLLMPLNKERIADFSSNIPSYSQFQQRCSPEKSPFILIYIHGISAYRQTVHFSYNLSAKGIILHTSKLERGSSCNPLNNFSRRMHKERFCISCGFLCFFVWTCQPVF